MAQIPVGSVPVEITFRQNGFAVSDQRYTYEPVVSLSSQIRSNVAVIGFAFRWYVQISKQELGVIAQAEPSAAILAAAVRHWLVKI